jgi:succinate-semialdehyde dehydrogenase/glutarate-semialdehyde dehydrogenase
MHDRLALYIDGEWVAGTSRQSGAVFNPATGLEIGRVPFATTADLDRALAAADRGFRIWRAMLAPERAAILRKIAALLREQQDDIARIMTLEQGKPLAEAKMEVLATAELTDWLAEESRRLYGRVVPSRAPNTRTFVIQEPIGPVAAFSPWNFPCMMPGRKIAHALAAGCSIVLKPAEETPGTALALGKVCEQAGVPKGVVNIVFGEPAKVSEYLIKSPVIRKVSLTGSAVAGRHVGGLAGQEFKKVTLELGGHAPAIIFDDADLDRAVALSVASRFRNAGQVCTAPSRFFVQSALYDKFVAGFTAAAKAITVGDGMAPATRMGPLANLRRLDAMEKMVANAETHGGQVAAGGRRIGNSGFFFSPTVVTGLNAEADLMQKEPFGPLTPIMPFDSFDQVVADANSLPYGLAAYAFTSSQARSARLAEQLEAGVIAINGMTVTAPEGPFGGMKESGTGRESGIEGLAEYTNVKTVTETFSEHVG